MLCYLPTSSLLLPDLGEDWDVQESFPQYGTGSQQSIVHLPVAMIHSELSNIISAV